MFEVAVLIVSALAGALAAMTGFGIGSLLTPLLALRVETRLAVAAVAVPHAVGTALRFWLLTGHVDRRAFWSFGLSSAGGGLLGAWLQGRASSPWLATLFGVLLLFAAAGELSGLTGRLRFGRRAGWIIGAVSGVLGGLVGNQGGLRSAALLGFGLSSTSFVATATAVALVVDGARMPIYLVRQHAQLMPLAAEIAIATVGVALGTLVGARMLAGIPEVWFRRTLAVVLALLGAAMVRRGLA